MAIPLALLDDLKNSSPSWYTDFVAYKAQLEHWTRTNAIPDPNDQMVWDMGCGWGMFSLAFVAMGARGVIATDTVLDRTRMPAALLDSGIVRFMEGDTIALAPTVMRDSACPPAILFMHLVSEHVTDLPALFRAIRPHCSEHTRLFIHHDNYYQPVGHHDHGFLSYRPDHHAVESNAVTCWTSPDRCAASEAHRASLREERSWQWGEISESTRDPPLCEKCNYRIRAQPWAHLVSAERFTTVWPEPFFTTALNKITPFQLRQYLIEAGFVILSDVRDLLTNEIPPQLAGQFTEDDLRTFTVTIVATAN